MSSKSQLSNSLQIRSYFGKIALTIVPLALLIACGKNVGIQSTGSGSSSQPSNSQGGAPTTPITPGYKSEPLAWETATHSERSAWSASLEQIVGQYFSTLDQAKDIANFCPNYHSLNQNQKINLWADLFAATAYYESAWDPANSSVDVGSQNNPDTWSVGLLQMSVVDQVNYGLSFGFNFADLQSVTKNLQLGVAIMSAQISKYGVVQIPAGSPGVYWATLHPGGKYDQTANVVSMTEKLSFCR